MKLRDLSIENLDIPFRVEFQHSSAERYATEAVLVTAKTECGLQQYGEGCPRPYVTGESLQSANAFFRANRSDFLQITALEDLTFWMDSHRVQIDSNPAAFCAVELALLNTLASEAGQSVEALLSLSELSGEFYYTGVLGARNSHSFQAQLQQYVSLGITDFKVKVFGDSDIDQANITALKKSTGEDSRVRLDANNLWSDPDEVVDYVSKLDCPVFALEEPLAVNDSDGCRKLFECLGTKIILDESFTREAVFEHLLPDSEPWAINIRVSKMGGILRSLVIAEKARQLGIPVIIGAQVGETSVLTRAALTVAGTCRRFLLAQEGAFGTYLLERDVVTPPIMFGPGGVVKATQCKSYSGSGAFI